MNEIWKGGVAYGVGSISAMLLTAWLCGVKWWILPAAVVGGILGQSLYILACDLRGRWEDK